MTGVPQILDDRAPRTWPEPPTPFMSQPRAHSALRRELDAIAVEIKPSIDRCRSSRPDETFELIVLPHRVIARVNDEAVSFSWVNGRNPTVANGCLLVIAWSNVANGVHGAAALKSATPTDEQSYTAQGGSPDDFRWRGDDIAVEARSTAHLTADWMAHTSIARSA